MSKASDNPFPSVLVVEGSAPASPASGDQRVFIDVADHKLKRKNSSGTVTTIEGGGGGSLELTDGTTDLTSVTKITTTMLTVGGTAGASTLIPTLTTASAQLAADVTCTPNTTFVDGPSVSLAAGTWLLMGQALVRNTGTACFFAAKLWDGTTAVAGGETTTGSANWDAMIPLMGIVTPGSTTTYKISAAADDASLHGAIKASSADIATGNYCTRIVAVKIA